MLYDFLREIQRQKEAEEMQTAAQEVDLRRVEESKESIVTQSSLVDQKQVTPDIKVEEEVKCQICLEQQHKYKCSRCDILYCSVKCFQAHNKGQCNEDFSKDQVEQELKNTRSSQKQRNHINDMLYKQFRGDEEESKLQDNGISVARLEELLTLCQGNDQNELKLTDTERKEFAKFMENHLQKEMKVWEPWWADRKEISTKIQEVKSSEEGQEDINMNTIGQDKQFLSEQDNQQDSDSDFEDIESDDEEQQDQSDTQEQSLTLSSFQGLFSRRVGFIPELNQILRGKEPAATLPYLVASNALSFLFFSRYYNGALLETEPLKLSAVLNSQLLSKESQQSVEADFTSAYLDAMKSLVHIGQIEPANVIKSVHI